MDEKPSQRIKEIKELISSITREIDGNLTSMGWVMYHAFLKHAEDDVKFLLSELDRVEQKVKKLEEAVDDLPKNKIEEVQRIMRENNFVIDNLDDRWQKLCFTFYTDICDMQTKIEALYRILNEIKNGS